MRPLRHRVADAIGNTKARKGKSKMDLADAAIGALGFTWEDVALLKTAASYDPTTGRHAIALESLADMIEETLSPEEE